MEGREKRVDEKEVEKREKGKVVLGKALFLFLFDCVFASSPFFPAFTTPPHHNTRSHSPTTSHNMTHWCTPSHANRAVCCAASFWEWTKRHTASSTPLTPSLEIMQHTPTNQNTEDSSLFAQCHTKCSKQT